MVYWKRSHLHAVPVANGGGFWSEVFLEELLRAHDQVALLAVGKRVALVRGSLAHLQGSQDQADDKDGRKLKKGKTKI